jgi:hypothetical protein
MWGLSWVGAARAETVPLPQAVAELRALAVLTTYDGLIMLRGGGGLKETRTLGDNRALERFKLERPGIATELEVIYKKPDSLDGFPTVEIVGVTLATGRGPTLGMLRTLAGKDFKERRLATKKAATRSAVAFPLGHAILELELYDSPLWHHPDARSSPLAVNLIRLYSRGAAARMGIYKAP